MVVDIKLGSCPGLSQCVILVFSERGGRTQGIILGMIAAGTVKISILLGHKLKALPHGKYLCTPHSSVDTIRLQSK